MMTMSTRSLLLVALCSCAHAYPQYWLSKLNGGCKRLVSNRKGEDGMFNNGYRNISAPDNAAAPVTGSSSWTISLPEDLGWFVTAESGTLDGTGSPGSDCNSFRYMNAGTTTGTVSWTPGEDSFGKTCVIEVAMAPPSGKISYYAIIIDVPAASTAAPTLGATSTPSHSPSTNSPTHTPSMSPTDSPTTEGPTAVGATKKPTTPNPTTAPTIAPTKQPTASPSDGGTKDPTTAPTTATPSTAEPATQQPTASPTAFEDGDDEGNVAASTGLPVMLLTALSVANALSGSSRWKWI